MSSKRLKGPDETPADSLVARVRGEYSEMPGLRVTLEQACRLWQLDATTCEKLLNHLVCGGFLYKNESGFYIASSVTHGRAVQISVPILLTASARQRSESKDGS